jgi:hypothetical protein
VLLPPALYCLQDNNDETCGDDNTTAATSKYISFNMSDASALVTIPSPSRRISYDTSNDDDSIIRSNNACAPTAGNTNINSSKPAVPKPNRVINFNLGDTDDASADDLTMELSDYAANTSAFHTERRKVFAKPPSPKCSAADAPRCASPTQIAALNARKGTNSSNAKGLTSEEKQATKARGAAQRSAHLAAIDAKAALRDAMLAGFETQEEVDAYYAAEVDPTAADAAAEPKKMTFEEEWESVADLVAQLEAAKNANKS